MAVGKELQILQIKATAPAHLRDMIERDSRRSNQAFNRFVDGFTFVSQDFGALRGIARQFKRYKNQEKIMVAAAAINGWQPIQLHEFVDEGRIAVAVILHSEYHFAITPFNWGKISEETLKVMGQAVKMVEKLDEEGAEYMTTREFESYSEKLQQART